MKLLITGGSLEAEIQNNPLTRIQKQLASISQKSELDIKELRTHIDRISEIKDGRIDKLYDELQERNKLEDLEIEELKGMILAMAKDTETLPTGDIDSLRDKLQGVASDTKDMINKINSKIDRISKDQTERAKRVQEEMTRIINEDKKKIAFLKSQIAEIHITREKARKVLESRVGGLDAKRVMPKKPGVKDGTKYMGKLNWKPKLPI